MDEYEPFSSIELHFFLVHILRPMATLAANQADFKTQHSVKFLSNKIEHEVESHLSNKVDTRWDGTAMIRSIDHP